MANLKGKKLAIKIVIIFILTFLCGLWWYSHLAKSPPVNRVSTDLNIGYKCNGGSASMPCLQAHYKATAKKDGPTAAFKELKSAYAKDPNVRAYCHQITHAIGRWAAEMSQNIEDAYGQGDNFCWSGYYHGVMEAIVNKIGVKNLDAAIPTLCDSLKAKQPYSFYHYNCVHGLGHGIMFVKDGNLFASLTSCGLLTDSWGRDSCYGGVFMQNVMDELDNDHGKPYLKADDPMYPCTAVAEQYKSQCYLMQTSHALKVAKEDFSTVFSECSAVEPVYRDTCYQSLGRDASGNSASDIVQTKASCMITQNQEARTNCVIGAVKDFISYYHSDKQANGFCEALEPSLTTICQTTKQQYYSIF
ncbi:MAG TPA: hypothetical protein VNX65_01205 [Patescibacteria group bacterium]|nr:hypothetical protein [Patescibacteria group bacterium]